MKTAVNNREQATAPHINVTPLIDVLLVLLIIFMVVSPLKPSRFKALIPQPPDERQTVVPNPLTLVVSINKDLQLKLNEQANVGTINDISKLSATLGNLFQERKEARTYRCGIGAPSLASDDRIEKTVFIKAPRSIRYGDVAKVIDAIKGAGATPVGLQVDDLAQ